MVHLQILAVNGQDVANSMQEDVAAMLKTCVGRVCLKVSSHWNRRAFIEGILLTIRKPQLALVCSDSESPHYYVHGNEIRNEADLAEPPLRPFQENIRFYRHSRFVFFGSAVFSELLLS